MRPRLIRRLNPAALDDTEKTLGHAYLESNLARAAKKCNEQKRAKEREIAAGCGEKKFAAAIDFEICALERARTTED